MKKLITIAILAMTTSAFAGGYNEGNHNNNEGGNITNQGGAGGKGGDGGTGVGIAGAVAGAYSGATGGASGASSNAGSTQTMEGGNYRSLSLASPSVGSPDHGTCVAHASVLFGLATFPMTQESCIAINEATFLLKLDMKEAALDRLCQLDSVAKTRACPQGEKKIEEIR